MNGAPDKRVGLHDVASRAEVALSTASNALNGRGRVAATTRDRVRAVADELGYLPHPVARGLRVGRSRMIGVAVRMYLDEPDRYPADIYYGLLITACSTTASRRGYALALLPQQALDVVADLPLAAIIVTDTETNDPALEHAHTLGIPVITDYRPDDSRSAVVVDADVPAAVSMVNDHLVEAGARRVGLLSIEPGDNAFAAQWEKSHAGWCDKHGFDLTVDRGPAIDVDRLEAAATRLWNAGCDAVVGIPIGSGLALLDAAAALGKRVPADVLVAAVDENPDLAISDPPLTTVGLDPVATAVQGTNLVIDVIEGKVQPPVELFVPGHLNVRASTQR